MKHMDKKSKYSLLESPTNKHKKYQIIITVLKNFNPILTDINAKPSNSKLHKIMKIVFH